MEYIFGTSDVRGDILKTVDKTHSDLVGRCMVERTYADNIITDIFDVTEKYLSKVDGEGNCYDWYAISNHYRYMDKFTPQKEQIESSISETQEGLMEAYDLSAENADDMADVRTALEEIYEMIIGGDDNG